MVPIDPVACSSRGHDSDLEGPPWSGGNAASDVFANLLIIAENDVDANNDGLIDDPDDEAGGGSIIFRFDTPIFEYGFSLIDIEVSESDPNASVMLFNEGILVGIIDFGDSSANHIQPMSFFDGIDPLEFDEARFVLQGSGAIDNIFFESVAGPVPAPGPLSLLLFSLIAVGGRRRQAA